MVSNSKISRGSIQADAESDLLHLLLEADPLSPSGTNDDSIYPWNPAAPEAEEFFANLEPECEALGWGDAELTSYAHALSQTMESLWASIDPSPATALPMAALQEFQVPQSLLNTIMQRAQQMIESNLSIADQLVQCVRDVLPNLADDDLQVLARPYAFAMRGSATETLEVALRTMRCAAWTELSGIEQARLSLAIARYAIAQSPSSGSTQR
jgi:hypothetical protein